VYGTLSIYCGAMIVLVIAADETGGMHVAGVQHRIADEAEME
jgi:hypothetical protein